MTYTFTIDDLDAALYACELDEVEGNSSIYPLYSGRGMYGVTCFGTTLALGDAMQLLIELFHQSDPMMEWEDIIRDVADVLNNILTDEMGMETVQFFPMIRIQNNDVACGSRGPRIGNDGTPVCALPQGHAEAHQSDPVTGFDEQWSDDSLTSRGGMS